MRTHTKTWVEVIWQTFLNEFLWTSELVDKAEQLIRGAALKYSKKSAKSLELMYKSECSQICLLKYDISSYTHYLFHYNSIFSPLWRTFEIPMSNHESAAYFQTHKSRNTFKKCRFRNYIPYLWCNHPWVCLSCIYQLPFHLII